MQNPSLYAVGSDIYTTLRYGSFEALSTLSLTRDLSDTPYLLSQGANADFALMCEEK